MIIKKFKAETEKDAILLAKEELGGDAVVMNIKTTTPKGFFRFLRKPYVEVTAAIDENMLPKGLFLSLLLSLFLLWQMKYLP